MITLPSGRKIGQGEKPFIIAEIGSNWKTVEDCLTSISLAKKCGADAVKFQLYTYTHMYGFNEFLGVAGPGHDNHRIHELPGELNPYWLPKLKDKADAVGIEFMCSAFSVPLLDEVNKYVNIHKVASAEMTHVRMLERLREIGKPVIMSTGASGMADIEQALDVLGDTPVILLHCVAAYPARATKLGRISELEDYFGESVGYSDHSLSCDEIPHLAMELGACVLEKHVNFIDGIETPDSPHSLTAAEFKHMAKILRGESSVLSVETYMISRHNRRLIATCDIAVGDTLTENENFGIHRSLQDESHAYSPFLIDQVNGKVATKAIKAGDGIGPGDA